MTLHKYSPSKQGRSYGTESSAQSEQPNSQASDSGKSNRAARMAQALGSQHSWADTYAPHTPPGSVATPAASTVDGDEQEYLLRRQDPDDPPPAYDGPPRVPELSGEPVRDNRSTPSNIILPPKPLPTRSYTRHETSQSITGTFTFFDLLDLSTTSGSIRIVIDPQPGEKPAVLRLSSTSGSIRVDVAESYVNRLREKGSSVRPWDTSIKSTSGSLRTKLPIGGGSNTVLQAQSASIAAIFIASDVGPYDNVSTLITESASGSQNIVVQPVIGTTSIANLVARHYSSGSASLKVGYPQLWQGVLHASVGGSATVKVQGDDLKFQYNGDKDVYAWRGEGQALDVRCDGSGSIKVDCSSSS